MKKILLNELVDRAENYFNDELIEVERQHNGFLFKFTEPCFAEQFVKESKAVKSKMSSKFQDINFEIKPDNRFVKIS